MAVDELPGGTAEDYSEHLITTVKHIALIYSRWHPEVTVQYAEGVMIKNILAVLSERAIVNQCAVNKVSALWKKDVHQLYCNIHPLETITREVKKCLKDNEKGNLGKLFNSKSVCLMERVIMAMNKMRFNDKVGDPKGFVNLLVLRKLGKGLLKRARGKRIHLNFHLAELYMIHYDVFVEFLESYCTVSNPLRNSLCMAIFGNIFSRVWMKMFYTKSSDELTITHIGAYKLVVEVIETINSMTKDLQQFLTNTRTWSESNDHDHVGGIPMCVTKTVQAIYGNEFGRSGESDRQHQSA